ncbi:sporulation protein YunB [Oceanobacillus sp. J11TS1]|uniref:sporulation protein YunB n=1 Tax=Oceanobacillus sp. J11TS1 TaxID=2807191 RepID=UPI001B295D47|nr:sporulation protein YunB [Oceanobacillus sp. J11TS1]GIO25138.1 sporulation protein YunB [Oceanobacillus sp. J11TS1]
MRFKKRYRYRVGRKRRIHPSRRSILMLTFILFFAAVGFSFYLINVKIEPIIIDIAKRKADEFATRAINSAVFYVEEYGFDDILNITYDNEGNLVTYNRDPAVISEINRVATDRVEEYFAHVNRGEQLEFEHNLHEPYDYEGGAEGRAQVDPTLIEIPLGQITGNSVLANLGPKIPINMEVVGAVRTNVVEEKEPFGINGAWVSLYINVEADVQIVVPFTSEVRTVHTELYLDGGAIMGKVPDFYGGDGNGPNIAVPKDDLQNN